MATKNESKGVLPSEATFDVIILQNWPNMWQPLIKRMKDEGDLHPEFSFLSDTRMMLWLNGKDPDTGESVNKLLFNDKCEEYIEAYTLVSIHKPGGDRVHLRLENLKLRKKIKIGYFIAVNHNGTWVGTFDFTPNVPGGVKKRARPSRQ